MKPDSSSFIDMSFVNFEIDLRLRLALEGYS
jgi:hypothetical protein